MADVNVNFMHPTDGRVISVTIDETMTAQEAVGELLANDFVPPHVEGYHLSLVESGNIIGVNQTLAGAGVRNGSKIHVLPTTPAGNQ